MNFKSFEAVDGSLHDAWASLEKRNLEQVQESLEEGKRLISVRMKEIPLADKHGWDFVNEYQNEVVILLFPLNLLQMFLPLILAISLLACATTAVKTAIIGEIARPKTLRADSTTPSQACFDSSHLYSPLEVLPLPRVLSKASQDDNELYSNVVESVVNVRQLEGEFVDSVHVDKSEDVQGRIAKS